MRCLLILITAFTLLAATPQQEVLGVLAIPGPTNSLLFVSGVSRGF